MTAATVTARKSYSTTAPAYTPAPQGKVSFSFRNVAKQFGGKAVLQGINLDVYEGQFVAVIGKSGCGKSTLLRLLPGSTSRHLARLLAGVLEDDAETYPHHVSGAATPALGAGAANVGVGLTGIEKGEAARKKSLEILAEVGLADRGGEWPSVLSGGQRQRVALARALVGHPSILALDEPLGALDALTRIEMQQLLERIWLAKKFTAVLVTHDVAEAVSLADRVVVIDSGRIALDLAIPVERPRRHASPELAFFERQILDQLYNR